VCVAELLVAVRQVLIGRERRAPGEGPAPEPQLASPSIPDRVRWLPWLRRSASWQAAYNSACLYAALAGIAEAGEDEKLKYQDRVIVSLERVVGNRYSEMERAHD
jgi:hypothetical protein